VASAQNEARPVRPCEQQYPQESCIARHPFFRDSIRGRPLRWRDSVTHDCLRVFATDALVIDRVTSLHVNPAFVKSAILETTVKVIYVTHHPRHFDTSLERQMALRPDLPPRGPPEARDDSDFIQVNDVT
jgi:hypothetical protein